MNMRKIVSYALSAAVGCVISLGAVALSRGAAPFNLPGSGDKGAVLTKLEETAPARTRTANENLISKASATILPSVVTIQIEGTVKSSAQRRVNPFSNNPLFRQFFGDQFGDQDSTPQKYKGVGSGVIISDDGYILTNNHVVAINTDGRGDQTPQLADKVKVVLNDGKAYNAKVVGCDQTSDIAVVKIDAPAGTLKPAVLGNSKDLEVGDMVIAAGNPLNIGTTVTFGIISALGHRNTEVTGPQVQAENIIQTDAAINEGNSGGALADMDGRVIGINEAIISSNQMFAGIGLAIPINRAKEIAYQIIKNGRVVRPYIGIAYQSLKIVPEEDRAQLGITTKGDAGVVVAKVLPGAPAADAGIRIYDVILDASGQPIDDDNSLRSIIEQRKVGDKLVLRVARGDDIQLVTIKLKEMPKTFNTAAQSQNNDDNSSNSDQ